MHSTRSDGGAAAGAEVVAGSNSGPFKRSITKSARVPVPAVQNFRPGPSRQAAAHFGVYFCRNFWDRLRRIAGQVGLLSVLQTKAKLSMDSMPKK